MKVTKTNTSSRQFFNQTLTLTKGKTYTFSAYVKTSGISNVSGQGAALFVNYQDSTGYYPTIESRFISGTSTWQRVEVKFTLPTDSVSNTVYARAGIIGETGSAYFDCLQLEDGEIANRYNLVENGSFNYGSTTPDFWSRNSVLDSSDSVASIDGRTTFKMNGKATLNKGLYQIINVSGNAGDAFVLSGWGKGDSVPLLNGRYFAVDIGILRTDNTYQWAPLQFNEDSSEWQYISDVVIANAAYKSIELYIIYYGNANTAYFDDIQIYKEEFGSSYQYDSKGNIISTVDLAKQKSTFEYNTNNDLIKSTDPKGSSFTYEYSTDGKRNLTKATSAENVVHSFTYDTYGNPKTSKVGDSTTFIQSGATYTSDGNYIDTLTDSEGNTVSYDYNTTKGTLTAVTDANSKVTTFDYDGIDRLTSTSKVAGGATITNSYAYSNDRLSTITHNGFNYNFGYDALENNTTVSVGGQNLITNTYEAKTSRFLKATYGNGQYVSNDYDNIDRVTAKRYNGNIRYKYEYDASGNIGYHEDLVNGVNYRYVYDTADRLVKVNDSEGNNISYEYDQNNNASKINDNVNKTTYSTSYGYDKDNKPSTITYSRAAANSISLAYDILGRIKSKSVSIGSVTTPQFVTNYSYLAGINGATTSKVSSINNNGNSISYTYDKNGNIKTITEGGKQITYTYDELNELIREDNQVLNKTITYAYDVGGNIKSKIEYSYKTGTLETPVDTVNYTYGDTNWRDKLTNFDGKDITYDTIGNPLTYNGYTYTWEEGRQLKTITGNSQNISYKYNDSGIRTEKNAGGVITKYHLLGDKVTYETNGTDKVYYTYDSNGKAVSINISNATNIVGGSTPAGIFESVVGTGAGVVNVTIPQTTISTRAIRLNTGINIPVITSPQLSLKPNTNYKLEFDYWSDVDNTTFDVDLYPDDLPQSLPTAKTTLQHFSWELSSTSVNMANAKLRFFNDLTAPNPGNIYITNIKLVELQNIVGGSTPVGIFESIIGSNAEVVTVTIPQTTSTTRSLQLNSGSNIPIIESPQLNLKPNTNYKLEFDYWSDVDNTTFDVDLYPDDLPQSLPAAKTSMQHFSWQLNSTSGNMSKAQLRFFNDQVSPNPGNIFITNIKLNEIPDNIYANEEYYYIYNAQGDVIGLFDSTGTQVVSYTYDTWGKLISIDGSLKDSVGVKNPYRYRGYRYDTETGLYYLQSRYYSPEWGRFINADGIIGQTGELLGHNLFIYCKNNPINMSDPTGFAPSWLGKVLDGASGVFGVLSGAGMIASGNPLGILVAVHGVSQLAGAIGGEKYNFEKRLLGERAYLAYDFALGMISFKNAGVGLAKKGEAAEKYLRTQTTVKKAKGYVKTVTKVSLRFGKTSYDIADNVLGVRSMRNDINDLELYDSRNAALQRNYCVGSGGRMYIGE